MCDYSSHVFSEGQVAERINNICNVMDSLNVSFDEAANIMKLPIEERVELSKLLQNAGLQNSEK